jgi:hypothetical protein
MNDERLKMKGRLADLQKQIRDTEKRAETFFIMIREILDPLKEFLDLDLERAQLLISDFRALQLKCRELRDEAAKVDNLLNG